ncbi:hypothetical protein DFH08DRAFT_898004 [Mycena albidolilacea]|uniref:Secreted protein n=1 Tax=Mycena albidolilacea TaxID=1033008 RepID=A0AAD6Z7Z9_9AGAR|nr:hypothetical protein DFH08DRAFT_898004 [Mycena albidolilacea]
MLQLWWRLGTLAHALVLCRSGSRFKQCSRRGAPRTRAVEARLWITADRQLLHRMLWLLFLWNRSRLPEVSRERHPDLTRIYPGLGIRTASYPGPR